MTQGEISLVATQHSIMYALLAAKSPMTRAAIVKAANLGSKSGSHMKRAFDALEDSGMVEKVADGFKATQKANDDFNQVEGDEDAGSVIGGNAPEADAVEDDSTVVAEAEAVLEQAKTPSPAELASADADRLTDIAASVIEYDPALLSPPLGVKADIATLSKEDRAAVRKIVMAAPGTTSAENGARFTQLGLLTKDDVVKAEADKKTREAKKATEKKERAPKAANPNAPFMLAFTGSYKAREGGVCHIIGRAVATSAKKTVSVEDVLAALKAERPEDGEKYLKEGVRLLVTRNVITEVTGKDGAVVGYATTPDVKKMVNEQLKAREATKTAPAK